MHPLNFSPDINAYTSCALLGRILRPPRSTPTSPAATRAEPLLSQQPTAEPTSKFRGKVKGLLHLPGRHKKDCKPVTHVLKKGSSNPPQPDRPFNNTALVSSTISNHPHSLLNTPHQHSVPDGFSAAAEGASLAAQPTSSLNSTSSSSASYYLLDDAPRRARKPIPSFQPPPPPSPPTAPVSASLESPPPSSWMLDASPPRIRKPIPQSWLEGGNAPSAEQSVEHPAMEANPQPGVVSEDNSVGTDEVTLAPPASSIQQSSSANGALQHPSLLIVHGLEDTRSSGGNAVNPAPFPCLWFVQRLGPSQGQNHGLFQL
ncbi:hypothetical protein FRC01_002637 [Tulasnella sp. 417]|nr:hypothetical protein FRC01_002637 [Tulasnella sp. 417]